MITSWKNGLYDQNYYLSDGYDSVNGLVESIHISVTDGAYFMIELGGGIIYLKKL